LTVYDCARSNSRKKWKKKGREVGEGPSLAGDKNSGAQIPRGNAMETIQSWGGRQSIFVWGRKKNDFRRPWAISAKVWGAVFQNPKLNFKKRRYAKESRDKSGKGKKLTGDYSNPSAKGTEMHAEEKTKKEQAVEKGRTKNINQGAAMRNERGNS